MAPKLYQLKCEHCGEPFRVDAEGLARVRRLVACSVISGVRCECCRFADYLERVAVLLLVVGSTRASAASPRPQHPGPQRWA